MEDQMQESERKSESIVEEKKEFTTDSKQENNEIEETPEKEKDVPRTKVNRRQSGQEGDVNKNVAGEKPGKEEIGNRYDKTNQSKEDQNTKKKGGLRRKSQVHPTEEDITEKKANEVTEETLPETSQNKEPVVELDPEKKKVYGVKLLNLISSNKGKKDDILVLIEVGAKVDVKNEAGWQAIHFAAADGSVSIINALVEKGATPNCYDKNFQTPLHVAARRGQVASIIALVAHGAVVDTRDWEGNVPLDLAVAGRHVRVTETLFLFGAEPYLIDWTWTVKDENKFTKDEREIISLFATQLPLVPGYKYGGISLDVGFLKPGKSHLFKPCGATMLVDQAKTPFFVFCCKMQSEYADLKSYLKNDQSPFSDMYECRTWGLSRSVASFTLTVEGMPNANEITDLVSPQGKIGRVDNIQKKEEENKTVVTVTLKLAKGKTQFALALRREPEKFQITKEAVVIQPKNEPDAAIDIPEGTFDKAAELQLNVVETKDVNEDEESGPILMTNVIDMSMSDGQQPQKGIDMKLPIHSKGSDDIFDMCVLATSEEDPDDIDDWEIIEAVPDKNGKSAVFKIDHFSIYAGASKKKIEHDKKEVVDAVTRSLNRTRKVEFSVYIQMDSKVRGVFQLIVEVTSPKQTDKRRKQWQKKGYEIQSQKDPEEYIVAEKQRFVLSFEGNMANKGKEDRVFIDYESKKKSKYLALDMEVPDIKPETTDVSGSLKVEMEIEIEVSEKEIVPDGFCKTKEVEVKISQTKLQEMVTLPVGMTFQKEEPVIPLENILPPRIKSAKPKARRGSSMLSDPDEEFLVKTYDKDNTIPGLGASKFWNIASKLDLKDAQYLGLQLGMNRDKLTEIIESDGDSRNVIFEILMRYRGKRPHWNQVSTIAKALHFIGRTDLAGIIESSDDNENKRQAGATQEPGQIREYSERNGDIQEVNHTEEQYQLSEEKQLIETVEEQPTQTTGTQEQNAVIETDAKTMETEQNL